MPLAKGLNGIEHIDADFDQIGNYLRNRAAGMKEYFSVAFPMDKAEDFPVKRFYDFSVMLG